MARKTTVSALKAQLAAMPLATLQAHLAQNADNLRNAIILHGHESPQASGWYYQRDLINAAIAAH